MNEEPKTDQTDQAPKAEPTQLAATLELARRGNQAVLGELRRTLDAHPEIWQHFGDLTRVAEEAYIKRLSGSDLLTHESLRRTIDQKRVALAGPTPTPLERLIVNRAIVSELAASEADLAMALADKEGPKIIAVRIKAANAAHGRVMAATKCLAQVRRLQAGINIRVEHAVVPTAQTAESEPAAERLRGLVDEPKAMEVEGVGSLSGMAK